MSTKLRYSMPAFLQLAAILLTASPSLAASWKTGVTYGGSGPTMDLYVPDKVDASPGVVVALHYCSGNAGSTHSWFQSLADQHGFLIISPNAGKNCWDASPGRTAEKAAIAQMVKYAITQYKADPARVFAAGASSGACMTNTLLASYPDVFAGGSVLAGVPVGAWTGGNECGACGQNPPNKTAQQWGDVVRNVFSFDGTRPKVQLFHGTSDTTLNYSNLAAEVSQWTNVLGVSDANATKESGKPKSGWERTSYKDSSGTVVLEVNIGQGQPHDLTGQGLWSDVVRFFGLDKDPPPNPGADGGIPVGGTGGTAAGAGGSAGTGGRANLGGANNTGGTNGAGGRASVGGANNTGGAKSEGSGGNTSDHAGGGVTGGAGKATTAGTTSHAGGGSSVEQGGSTGSAGGTGQPSKNAGGSAGKGTAGTSSHIGSEHAGNAGDGDGNDDQGEDEASPQSGGCRIGEGGVGGSGLLLLAVGGALSAVLGRRARSRQGRANRD